MDYNLFHREHASAHAESRTRERAGYGTTPRRNADAVFLATSLGGREPPECAIAGQIRAGDFRIEGLILTVGLMTAPVRALRSLVHAA